MCAIRKVDPLGRIVIPKDIRDLLKLDPGVKLLINFDLKSKMLFISKIDENYNIGE